jgi:isopentenyl diphosphate isomerase/L-lactate dehydrogenase-like FMN-dependent dehydrogenase
MEDCRLSYKAVGDKTYIMFDSGVRGAADVFKALAIGAKFVFIGRLWIWGLSIAGEHGVSTPQFVEMSIN